jgi:hypothetical protein
MVTDAKSLKSMSLSSLDAHIKNLVCSERKITDQILNAITELDLRRGYTELGFSSLFSYLTVGLGYSESSAQRRITSARLIAKVSEPVKDALKSKLKEGTINLSQVSKLSSMINQIEQKDRKNIEVADNSTANKLITQILPTIENKNSVKTENAIASMIHDSLTGLRLEDIKTEGQSKAKIKQDALGKVTITLTLTKEQNEKLQKVLAKKSHTIPNGDINILFEKLLDRELKNFDVKSESASTITSEAAFKKQAISDVTPIKKTIFSELTNTDSDLFSNVNIENDSEMKNKMRSNSIMKRKYISIDVKRRIFANANHQCQYISSITKIRCQENNFLTIDHVVPVINWPN